MCRSAIFPVGNRRVCASPSSCFNRPTCFSWTSHHVVPALEVLEVSLAEFIGAWVLVSHDRELMDRLCTEVVGLDGRGGAALYGSVDQWLTAYERGLAEREAPVARIESRPKV